MAPDGSLWLLDGTHMVRILCEETEDGLEDRKQVYFFSADSKRAWESWTGRLSAIDSTCPIVSGRQCQLNAEPLSTLARV